jgi:hypothetical protein
LAGVQALREVARLGGFFAVETRPIGPEWRPLADLAEPATLGALVDGSRAYLAERAGAGIEPRAAASVHFLGTAARLLSPVLAATVRHGVTPALGEATVRWRPAQHGTVAFAITAADTATLDQAVRALDPLAAAVQDNYRLSARILAGNVASALAGAALMLRGSAPATVVPLIADAGSWQDGHFRRTSCCLFYRIPGGGLCGDCVLRNR